VIRLVDIRSEAFTVDEVLRAVDDPAAGGVVSFTGLVRASDGGREVTSLEYSAHPSALDRMTDVVRAVDSTEDVVAVAALHRVGPLVVGDVAVVVAASAAHRDVAFLAARRLIDEIKEQVPIWKHQLFADGTEEWVGTP
jgi:molybdopterin synthase catalytic subunit